MGTDNSVLAKRRGIGRMRDNYFVEGLQGAGKSTLLQRLSGKPYRIIYLDAENIREGIEIIRKERSDDKGNELWFPLMIRYLEESPYGEKNVLRGMDGLIKHLERRKNLEHRIMSEVFRDKSVIVKAKDYDLDEII